ncbi:ATP-binding protein [Nocardioides albus]|uniref:Signal transduction histidine kinase n=1 Tax=Nocardioides albus TaxID=1841 RepID=A0A7W5A0L2_9ACTN|nr:ATP-binding protein [Nocardioides albus]MBB3087318.1 signal transduction histidine kinase [Nocardioides albus]
MPHSTRAAAVRLVAFFVAGMRLATLAQMAPTLLAAMPALSRADHPWLTGATWILATVMLVVIAAVAVVTRRPPGVALAVVDVAVAVALLVVGLWTVPVELRTGSWVGFQLGYALCVSCSLSAIRSRWLWMFLLVSLALAEAVYIAPTVDGLADLTGALSTWLTLLILGPLAWFGCRTIVRIGTEADEARRYAAAAAKAEEERRARLAIHNGTAMMRLLVETDAADGNGALRSQAEVELNRMRAYLSGHTPAPANEATNLAAVATALGAEFDDLPITVVADLAQDITLPRALADDLAAALRSLLLNVRQHAQATRVVLHAAEDEDGSGWEVTLHDDGIGFDTSTTAYGVGLREVVVTQLARSGVDVEISSIPDLGTTVTLTQTTASVQVP